MEHTESVKICAKCGIHPVINVSKNAEERLCESGKSNLLDLCRHCNIKDIASDIKSMDRDIASSLSRDELMNALEQISKLMKENERSLGYMAVRSDFLDFIAKIAAVACANLIKNKLSE